MNRREGVALIAEGRYEEGLSKLSLAMQEAPHNASIRTEYLKRREEVENRIFGVARSERVAQRYESAELLYRRILMLDPENSYAKSALVEIDIERRHAKLLADAQALAKKGDMAAAKSLVNLVLVEDPTDTKAKQLRYQLEEQGLNENLSGPTLNIKGRRPVTLQFRDANLKLVLEAISRMAGVNILLDKDVRNDIRVTIFVKDTPVEETLDLILLQNQLEKRVLGENSVLIYPLTPAKTKDYQELKVRRFALVNADAKEAQNMIKSIIKTKDYYVDEKNNAIVIRDTPQAIRLVDKLLAAMDQPEPEVMLDIDVMQVNRDRFMQLGLDLPTSFAWSMPLASTGTLTLEQFKKRTSADIGVSGVTVTATAKKTDSDTNSLASPKLRVRNKEKAKILIGTRVPVVSSAATPSVTGGTTVFNTTVQYVETGVKLEVEPSIHRDGQVAIKLNLEVSTPGAQNPDAAKNGTIVFPVATNNLSSVLQLKDGETQIMGGLIQNQLSSGQTKIPGLGDIPLLGRLFGSRSDTWNKDELVIAITPHIVRNSVTSDADLIEVWSGTENVLKAAAPNLKAIGSSGVTSPNGSNGISPAKALGRQNVWPTEAIPALAPSAESP